MRKTPRYTDKTRDPRNPPTDAELGELDGAASKSGAARRQAHEGDRGS